MQPPEPCGPALAVQAELVVRLLTLPVERRRTLLLLSRPTLTPGGHARFTRGWWISQGRAQKCLGTDGIVEPGTSWGRPCAGGPLHHRKPYETKLDRVLAKWAWWPVNFEVWARAVEIDPRARLERRRGRWHARVVYEGEPRRFHGATAPKAAIVMWEAQAAGLESALTHQLPLLG